MAKANKAKQALSIIRNYFTNEEMLKLATAYFYSTLYYGAKVWLMSSLNHLLKKQLWRISSYMLKLVDGRTYNRMSFECLHKKYKRATPSMWCKYVTALAMWEVTNRQVPEVIFLKLLHNTMHEERRQGILFTRSNQSKMGFNCLSNRLQVVSKTLKLNWQDLESEQFKKLCKKTFILQEIDLI